MIVDLIIIAIVAVSTFLAYQKGLVNLAIGLCAFVVSIVITVILYQPISNLVIHVTSIDEMIEDAIYEKANDILKKDEKQEDLTNQVIEMAKDEMLPETARNLAVNIVTGGVIILLFIGVRITLTFVSAFANAVAKLPIIDQINKAGGLVYGALRGILILYVILLVMHIPTQINSNNAIYESIQQSYLGKTMYENNILNVFF